MKIKTESGSQYLIEDGTLTRISEIPLAYSEVQVFDRVPLKEYPNMFIGERALFRTELGPIHTTRVVSIED